MRVIFGDGKVQVQQGKVEEFIVAHRATVVKI